MSNTYHQIHLQLVFAVKYRKALLDRKWRTEIFAIMGGLINQTGCKTLIVNGVEDHVHCFLSLNPPLSVSEVAKIVKARSSKYINDNKLTREKFAWQVGYGVFSYSHSHVKRVYRYIENQEAHHRKQTFKAEYIEILTKFEVPFEERFLFEDLI